ncbi:extracellular serine-rich protein [Lasiosphaeria ovina]|uniref:Extracellular serine-rich protein n=1 Tax=Lasiosphaeria ovina TaxID=92902 RepID=A0AAE0KMX3_9PEZI|nr:extracellular serine-rich protein [Lasiosphaeria ovina]
MQASADTIKVAVGKSGLTFDPNSITAKVGDVVEFNFYAKNHSVVGGDFLNPCKPAEGSFFSGFFPTEANASQVFRLTVNSTDPIVFYCSQNTGSHCKNGMAGVINPTTLRSLSAYQTLAKALVGNATSPTGGVAGGVIAAQSGSGSTGTTGGSNTTNTAPPAATSTKPNGAVSMGAPLFGLVAAGFFAVLLI